MPVIRSTEGIAHEAHGTVFTAYANSSSGASELCAWSTRIPAGQPGVPHRVSREELLLVTAGTPRFTVDGTETDVKPGDLIVVPADSMLTVNGAPDQETVLWVTTSRGLTAELADGTEFVPPWAQ